MSRIGKQPIEVPAGVQIQIGDEAVEVKGPKGTLSTPKSPLLDYELKDNHLVISR